MQSQSATGTSPSIQPWIDASDRLQSYVEASSVGAVLQMDRAVATRLYDEVRRHYAGVLVDLARGTGRNDPCFCRSGAKFKVCCSPLIDLSA